ncbi:glycosyltransferase WbuB [Bacteroidia bacterium]|nr:glycosyltransferase WbuB [Bacteroidia bacterium]
MRNLWVISEFFSVSNATGYIMTSIVEKLAQQTEVNVISVGKSSVKEQPNTHIHTIKDIQLNKNKFFQRILKQLIISVKIFWKALRQIKRHDRIVCVTNPALVLLFLYLVKVIKRSKLIIIVHDIFPDNLLPIAVMKKNAILFRITHHLFSSIYRRADKVIAIGRDMQKHLQDETKQKDRIVFVPNFADITQIVPQKKETNRILNELGLTDKFVILFAGNTGKMQNISFVLEIIKCLQEDTNIHFLFIGQGACEQQMKNFITENKLTNITFLPYMDKSMEPEFMNAGDVGLISLSRNMKGTGVPSKPYQYMAAGKPLLALMGNDTETALMIEEQQIGWLIDDIDPIVAANKIRKIQEDKMAIAEKSLTARKVCEQHYSKELITGQYAIEILM